MNVSSSTVALQYTTELKKTNSNTTNVNKESKKQEAVLSDKPLQKTDTLEISSQETYYRLRNEMRLEFEASTATCNNTFFRFYAGDATVEDLKNQFKSDFESRKQTYSAFREYSFCAKLSDEQILNNLVTYYTRFGAGYIANQAMSDEGAKIADEYGGAQDHDWRYYNADFYYKSKELEEALSSAIDEVLAENNMTHIDKESLYPKDKANFSFHSIWNQSSYSQFRDAQEFSIKDTSIPPPKGFKLFYKSRQYSQADMMDGTVHCISASDKLATGEDCGSVSWYISVPKGQSLLKYGSLLDYLPLRGNERTGGTYNAPIVDLDGLLYRDGYTPGSLMQRVDDFVNENFNNFNNGIMMVGGEGFERRIDIPYRMSDGANPRSHNYINYGKFTTEDSANCGEYNEFLQNFMLNIAR